MLEKYFRKKGIIRRYRACLLGSHMDSFVDHLASLGFATSAIRYACQILLRFAGWMEEEGLGLQDLDDRLAGRFRKERLGRRTFKARAPGPIHGFVRHLRARGVIPEPPAFDGSPVGRLMAAYAEYLLVERGLLQVTVDSYVRVIRRFLLEHFGEGEPVLRDLRSSHIATFILRWARLRGRREAKSMVTALRSWFGFLLATGQIDRDLAPAVPSVACWRMSGVPRYLEPEEVERLLAVFDRATPIGRRDYAIVLLLARLGLRAGEVATLQLDDIDWRAGEIRVRGKGLLHDRLPLPDEVGQALAAYLRQDRPVCSAREVFIRSYPPIRAIAPHGTVTGIVSTALRKAGLHPPTRGPHLLRFTLGTRMIRAGASMDEIRQVLRHRSASTTEIYAKVDFASLRRLALPWPSAGGLR